MIEYHFKHILEYLWKCLCIRNLSKNKHKKGIKLHYLYNKCEDLLNNELDIVQIMRQARQTQILTQIILNQKQKMLLRFQRKNLVETSSDSSQESDSKGKLDTIRLMDNANPVIRLGIFGRIKRMISSFKNQ